MQSPAKRMASTPNPSREQALAACESEALRMAQNPSTVDFSKLLHVGFHDYPNGRTRVQSRFSAKNQVGMAVSYDITCLVMPDGRADEGSTVVTMAR
jgi:hypothetical protein